MRVCHAKDCCAEGGVTLCVEGRIAFLCPDCAHRTKIKYLQTPELKSPEEVCAQEASAHAEPADSDEHDGEDHGRRPGRRAPGVSGVPKVSGVEATGGDDNGSMPVVQGTDPDAGGES